MTETEQREWLAELTAIVERATRKREQRQAERQELKRRRNYGLAQRHARKTAHNRRQEQQP